MTLSLSLFLSAKFWMNLYSKIRTVSPNMMTGRRASLDFGVFVYRCMIYLFESVPENSETNFT